jgi:hypothetical protein
MLQTLHSCRNILDVDVGASRQPDVSETQCVGSIVETDLGVRLRMAVTLMLASQVVMLGSIFSTYLISWPIAGLISLGLYVALWYAEARAGIMSPITRLMTVLYALILGARWAGIDPAQLAHVPSLIYTLLALLTLGLLAAGQPFVALYSSDAGFRPLQWALSAMWGVLHLLSALAAWLLLPDVSFMLVPMALMLLGSAGTICMSFFTIGKRFDRQHAFEMNGFSFCQVKRAEDRERFYKVVADAYRTDLQRVLGARKRLDLETITHEQVVSDDKRDSAIVRFLAFEGDRPVGAICVYLDHAVEGLPIEDESGLDLADYRRNCRIAEMGKLAIVRSHRLNQSLLKGLFKCAVEVAAQHYISVIFNDSFAFQQRLYEKIGFSPLSDVGYTAQDSGSTGFGVTLMPMSLDLERMVALDASTTTSAEMRDQLNAYVMERYFKRITLKRLLRPRQSRLQPQQPQAMGRAA